MHDAGEDSEKLEICLCGHYNLTELTTPSTYKIQAFTT